VRLLSAFLNELQGMLAGWDQKSNIVLSNYIERFSMEGVEGTPLGLYLVEVLVTTQDSSSTPPYHNLTLVLYRCALGEIDQALEARAPWSEIRAGSLPHIRY
jgi:small nuclear ribonucleoprotein (snRNP)-like protein